jgi:phosphoglucosamine mutase
MFEGALAAGFTSCGFEVLLAGVIPTPAISFLIKDEHADLGAVISASHNPPEDNGIKFFERHGMKLGIEDERTIEAAMSNPVRRSLAVGGIRLLEAASTRYAAFLTGTIEIEEIDLSKSTIVVDCAYGATGAIAPRVLRHLNANVVELNTSLDGARINEGCGSTYLEPLRAAVIDNHADLGIAFDGDGDRVLLVSPRGETINGDQMMGIAALHMHKKGILDPPLVVTTVMSNLGLEEVLKEKGIQMIRTPVGDRNVTEAMLARGAQIGGEQSGHIIFSDHSPTGDGILTAVKLLEIAHESGMALGELGEMIPLFPQAMCNVPVDDPQRLFNEPFLQDLIEEEKGYLGNEGRILVRPSGTQPLLRVMVESKDKERSERICLRIAEKIKKPS